MSNQIVEREIAGFIGQLQELGDEYAAERLASELDLAKGNLTALTMIRDYWDGIIEPSTPSIESD